MPENKLNHLLVVTGNYPAPGQPSSGTFVREFVRSVARQGTQCSVIAPVAFHKGRDQTAFPKMEPGALSSAAEVTVYRPRYLSVSAWSKLGFLGRFNPTRLTFLQFEQAVLRTVRNQQLKPDAIYGHFLYFGGAAAVRIGSRLSIPAFPCVGEGELWTVSRFGNRVAQSDLKSANGFMVNNSGLGKTLKEDLGFDQHPIKVFPNGADLKRFFPRDRTESRQQLGLPEDQFLVGAVGNFLHKKGIVRVGEAIRGLPGVSGVFAGSGPLPPVADNISLCRRVSHDEMPVLMSACDVFVLPTLIEGSCNAIVEAMACGLPIISSTGAFNDDLLSDDMSIRIDPLDVEAIRSAIVRLKEDPVLTNAMAQQSAVHAKKLDVNQRAAGIVEFMKQHGNVGGIRGGKRNLSGKAI